MSDEPRDPTATPTEDDVLEDAQQEEAAVKELDAETEASGDEA